MLSRYHYGSGMLSRYIIEQDHSCIFFTQNNAIHKENYELTNLEQNLKLSKFSDLYALSELSEVSVGLY